MKLNMHFFIQVFFFCHQRPDRSFHFKGKPFPLCARCTGLLVGYLLSIILFFFTGLLKAWIVILLIIPMIIDGTGQLLGKWTSTNPRRFLTGFPAGIGISFIFFTIFNYSYTLGQILGKHFS